MAPLRRRVLVPFGIVLGLALGLVGSRAAAKPAKGVVVAVIGTAGNGRLLEAAADGARIAADLGGRAVEVVVLDDKGTEAGFAAALKKAKARSPSGTLVAREILDPKAFIKKLAPRMKGPVFVLTGFPPDPTAVDGHVVHLAPSPTTEAVFIADALIAPLSSRRVGVLHEETPWGREIAAGVVRNLSTWIHLGGIDTWPEGDLDEAAERAIRRLRAFEADWVVLAVRGARADALARALERQGETRALVFADGNRRASLLALAPTALARSVFVDGPDPEMEGRAGEAFLTGLERAGLPDDALANRGFEAVRRLLATIRKTGSTKGRKLRDAVLKVDAGAGTLGIVTFETHGALRFFPLTLWRVEGTRLTPFSEARAPTQGCGPPLGFGRTPPAEVHTRRGRIGTLTWGEGETRTIEKNLLTIGLSTDGEDPTLDAMVRAEILGRAIRIAHRLFHRETDGTAIPGWSWGITFTAEPPPEDLPRSKVWTGIAAGDHPAAGGQVIGDGLVAVYTTFLVRTMYEAHALDPRLSEADRPFLDGTWRWDDDPGLRRRADEIRCLMDGFASAMGLTLSHEFGHLCGCGHDTEHPTSIMNVVAGAGASWEHAVWIPSHQKNLDQALGMEGLR